LDKSEVLGFCRMQPYMNERKNQTNVHMNLTIQIKPIALIWFCFWCSLTNWTMPTKLDLNWFKFQF